jgi:hypothetical protein
MTVEGLNERMDAYRKAVSRLKEALEENGKRNL